jgi:alpha/beta superfamily hydrolase
LTKEKVFYKIGENKEKQLIGILHLPKQKNPPIVIVSHGFDGTKTDRKFVELARTLQKEGIATFRFDFEGCGDSEGKFEEMKIEKEASDLNSALKALSKIRNLNSNKLALVGHSLGAVVATLFIKNFKVPVKTMVFWNQAFNQRELFKIWHKNEEIRKWQKAESLIKGSKKLGNAYFRENKNKDWSTLLSEIPEIPILLIQGEKDEDVPLEFSEKLATTYKNIRLKILPKADHQFKSYLVRKKLISLSVGWLKKYL